MATADLKTLRHVDVRNAWTHEAHDFTPWLSENLNVLSVELGIGLELEGTEVQVGPYRADILARVPYDDSRVLIENQLENANLQHLGQVLAYLAGLEAQIVVWVATAFDEAHISAIRWLNEHTSDPFAFFAVRVGVVQIGASPLAPVFHVLERPNEWDRQIEADSGLTELGRFRRDFWAHFASRRPDALRLRLGYANSYVPHRSNEADLHVTQYLAQDRVGVYITGNRNETEADVRPRIEPFRSALKVALSDEELRSSNNHWCATHLLVDSTDRRNWDKMVDWLDDRRQVYERILRGKSDSSQ